MPFESSLTAACSPDPPAQLRVEVVRDLPSMRALGPEWRQLTAEANLEHPFLTHEWACTWWECFGGDKQLYLVTVRQGDKLVALAPMMISLLPVYGLKLRQLALIHNEHTPRLDLLVADGYDMAQDVIFAHLFGEAPTWDVLRLCQIPERSPTLQRVTEHARQAGCLAGMWLSSVSPYLTIGGDWNDYCAGLRKSHRQNMQRRWKRLSEKGLVRMETISNGGTSLQAALDDALHLEAAGWKGKAGTAIDCHPDVRRFYRQLAGVAADRGWLRLNFLTVNGKRIACQYLLEFRHRLFLLKPGYDPAYAVYSPGTLLANMAIQEAFESGIREWDFLGDDEPAKREWTKEARRHYWVFLFRKRFRAAAVCFVKFRLLPWLKKGRTSGQAAESA